MFYSTRSKLIISFLSVSLLVGVISLLVGIRLIYKTILDEAKTRISLDLNAASEIYYLHKNTIHTALYIASFDGELRSFLNSMQSEKIVKKLKSIAQQAGLEFAGIVLSDGSTLCRIGPDSIPPVTQKMQNPIADYVFMHGSSVSGTVILERDFLLSEDPGLAARANIKLLPTPMAAPRMEKEESSGMALASGIPLYEGGELLGVLYGGILLNRSNDIVDTVRETVFQDETFKGRNLGTATIFFKDLRISTNVITSDGYRAIGTMVSKEVRERVLIQGERWTDRAFVVSDWYITAYDPIPDIFGERVGMLYVGVLESKYLEVRRDILTVFVLVTLAGMIVAVGLGYIIANKIMRPIRQLVLASNAVSEGNLDPDIGDISKDETGVLQRTFSEMLLSIRERDRRQKADSEDKLILSEKQSSMGRLAAGVAHEINNPLTGVLTFTHMLLRRKDINDEVRSDLKTIARETERVRKIVKGLLDFSRQTRLDPEPTDINHLVESTLALVKNEALVNGLNFEFRPQAGIPVHIVDRDQLQSVLLNILINAFDATEPGGTVTIVTGIGVLAGKTEQKGIEISISDSGCGIPAENLDKLFDPFFTTKDVGDGTGLGLAVSYGIIERHGGTIRVQSKRGEGSTFIIWLPMEAKVEKQ